MTIASALPYSDVRAELLSQVDREGLKADIVVVDRIGVLFELYAACDAVFVGGSLVDKAVGGAVVCIYPVSVRACHLAPCELYRA